MSSSTLEPVRRSSGKGFTILELMIAVTIIGILAAIAIPAFTIIQQRSRITTFTNDLRVFHAAFTSYEAENANQFPETQRTDGVFPTGMEGLLSNQWISSRPIGGVYGWVYNPTPEPENIEAYILVREGDDPLLLSTAEMEGIDKNIDDGNLGTGKLVVNGTTIKFHIR